MPRTYVRRDPLDRFVLKTKKMANGCIEWTGSRDHGYGQFSVSRNKPYRASRASYEFFIGSILPGILVCHTCDNRACVNPLHLFLGTYKDNMQDQVKKNRSLYGERHNMRKLSDSDVIEIRRLRTSGLTNREIATRFGVCTSNVGLINQRITWRHLP